MKLTSSSNKAKAVFFTFACCLGACSAQAIAAEGTLKMKFVYGGSAPAQETLNLAQNGDFCGTHNLINEELVVDSSTNGIKNIVVYVYSRSSDIPEQPPANKTHELANKNCRFEPHVVLTQTGDVLNVTNPDPVGHNANLNFFRNTAQNLMIPAEQNKEVQLEEAEPAPIPIDCNIHPWMRAYVVVL
ncbi:MAG: methylamine utilization protein, partial [Planctomycetota bacterium]